jgi:HK97 family phage major capsid protein
MLAVGETSATDSTDTTPTVNAEVNGNLASLVGRTTISFQELADVDDLVSYLRDGFAIQAGRAQELAILVSADHATNALVGSPTGGLLAATVAGSPVTNATVNTITPTDLVNLSNSVDYSYFLEGSYLASQDVYGYLAA